MNSYRKTAGHLLLVRIKVMTYPELQGALDIEKAIKTPSRICESNLGSSATVRTIINM